MVKCFSFGVLHSLSSKQKCLDSIFGNYGHPETYTWTYLSCSGKHPAGYHSEHRLHNVTTPPVSDVSEILQMSISALVTRAGHMMGNY